MGRLSAGVVMVLAALVLAAGFPASAHAERRVALVIGNSSYKSLTALQNPRNDANGVAAALRDLNFEVMLRTDLDRTTARDALRDFSRLLTGADVAVVYYAGHALETGGHYYLVPIDGALEDAESLRFDMIPVAEMREILAKAKGLRMMIFDACRNDPLDGSGKVAPEAARAARREELARALAGAEGGQGMVVAYATAPFEPAQDGKAGNSPFTRALLKWLKEPELDLRPLFRGVSHDVFAATQGRQTPEISIALRGDYVLNPAPSHHSVWLSVRLSSDPMDLRDFIARFPYSSHRPLAQRRLDVLERARHLEEDARRAQEQRRQSCAAEASRIEVLRRAGGGDELQALAARPECPDASLPLITAALGALAVGQAAREEQERRTCLDEAGRHAALDPSDAAALTAFAHGARCPDVAAAAVAQAQRLEADHRRMEEMCARDQGELARLTRLGGEGREGLMQLQAATACARLKPLVLAALGTLPVADPPVNTPGQLHRAQASLRRLGCLEAADGWLLLLDKVRAGLSRYHAARGMAGAALDVDDAVVRRLEAERGPRVCPLVCDEGQVERGGACVPGLAAHPDPPRAKPAAKPKPAPSARPARENSPAPREIPVSPPVAQPAPPVAAAPPRRAPSVILGN